MDFAHNFWGNVVLFVSKSEVTTFTGACGWKAVCAIRFLENEALLPAMERLPHGSDLQPRRRDVAVRCGAVQSVTLHERCPHPIAQR
jgi:hypothetical protein